jgi:hypothetical protein
MTRRIAVLDRSHKKIVADFDNQHPSLVEYLKRYALRHATKDLLARTFLAIDEEGGVERVAGYFSLATVNVEKASVGDIDALRRLPLFPIHGVLLAREARRDSVLSG